MIRHVLFDKALDNHLYVHIDYWQKPLYYIHQVVLQCHCIWELKYIGHQHCVDLSLFSCNCEVVLEISGTSHLELLGTPGGSVVEYKDYKALKLSQ